MLVDVVEVEALPDYHLSVLFSDGVRGVFDMRPYLETGQYRELKDPSLFATVYVDCFTATWPGEIDIAPERIYAECVRA